MKIIFLRDTRNPKGKLQVPNAVHPEHIPKGTVLDIGGLATLKELNQTEERLAAVVAMELFSGAAVPYSVAAEAGVLREIAEDEKREANAKALDQRAASLGANAALADALARLAALPEAAAPRAPTRR
jgi:hypothetical protein